VVEQLNTLVGGVVNIVEVEQDRARSRVVAEHGVCEQMTRLDMRRRRDGAVLCVSQQVGLKVANESRQEPWVREIRMEKLVPDAFSQRGFIVPLTTDDALQSVAQARAAAGRVKCDGQSVDDAQLRRPFAQPPREAGLANAGFTVDEDDTQ